ncbi:hypothetical protein Tco_0272674 [Tanacetum coccineum]
MSLPDGSKEFVVYCDASNQGLGEVRTLMIDEAHASSYLVHSGADKTYYDLRDMYGGHVWKRILLPMSHVLWAEIGEIRSIGPELVQETTNKKYLADTNLHVHLEEIKVDKTLRFVEEPVEIIEREVKSLKRSRIPIVKSIGTRIKSRDEISLRRGYCDNCALSSESLLLTPLCCDDIHEVTPRVSASAGCDRLVSEPLVIEKIDLQSGYHQLRECMKKIFQRLPLGRGGSRGTFKVGVGAAEEGEVVCQAKIRESSLVGSELVQDTTDREKLKVASDCQKSYVDNMRKHLEWKLVIKVDVRIIILLTSTKYLADTNLHVHLEEIKVDKTLCFVEEPVEIIEREVKSLKRSRIPIVKSIGTRSEDGRCSCSVNVILRLELYAAFCTLVMGQAKSFISRDEIFPKGGDTVDNCAFERLVTVSIDLE